jgi:hemerythrin-like domain-containing protein
MAISLNARPDHGFDQPLGLLSDCHRRIEKFLGVLQRIAQTGPDGPLPEDHRRALTTALQYFRTASPRHNADEECSLFPRLRATDSDEARAALAALDALEADHAAAAHLHDQLDRLGRSWLDAGVLDADGRARFAALAHSLQEIYSAHIAIEDRFVFPTAARVLDADALADVGHEMAARRGLTPQPHA